MEKYKLKFHRNNERWDQNKTRFHIIKPTKKLNGNIIKFQLEFKEKNIYPNDQIVLLDNLLWFNREEHEILRWKHIEEYVKNEKVMVLKKTRDFGVECCYELMKWEDLIIKHSSKKSKSKGEKWMQVK